MWKTHFFLLLSAHGTKNIRQTGKQLGHRCLSLVLFNFTLLLTGWKDINHRVLMKFPQDLFKNEIHKHYYTDCERYGTTLNENWR
jgi:uncharacterized membrane-anchored protein YitT (DUF2179 family)